MTEKCDCQIYANFGFMSALKVHTQENRNDVKYLTNMIFFIEIWRLFLWLKVQVELISLMMIPL